MRVNAAAGRTLGFYRFWDVLDGFNHDHRQQIDVGEEDGSQVSSALMFIYLVPPPVSASVFFSYGILVFLAVNSSCLIFSAARARARTYLLHRPVYLSLSTDKHCRLT